MTGTRSAQGEWWDSDRTEMLRLLTNLDGSLAGVYRIAIDLMSRVAEPGEERARLANVGHCVRELLNNLPEALNDVPGVPERGHDEGVSAQQLASAIEDNLNAASANFSEAGSEEVVGGRSILIPSTLAEVMNQFAVQHREVGKRVARRDAASVLGRVDPSDPALKPWTAARDFFMWRTHLNLGNGTKQVSRIPSDEDVRVHISNIEASLRARLGAFYDTVHSLDDLLDLANRQHEEPES